MVTIQNASTKFIADIPGNRSTYRMILSLIVGFTLGRWVLNNSGVFLEETSANGSHLPRKIDPGWDSKGLDLYKEKVLDLSTKGVSITSIQPAGVTGTFYVSDNNAEWWEKAKRGRWEPKTFGIFNKYINPGMTTVVDFGTWIGPTLLYHGQYSKHSFGIEADPNAFAVVEYNVNLNKQLNPSWGNNISVDSGCVSRPEDVGVLTMRAGLEPGASMSGLGKVAGGRGELVSWQVQCYTLPELFKVWGIKAPYTDIFIKIDIESYECKLVPSFYEWLRHGKFLPKMFISLHPQIESCSDEEFEGILKFLNLYDHVRINNDSEVFPIKDAVASDLKGLGDVVIYQDHHLKDK